MKQEWQTEQGNLWHRFSNQEKIAARIFSIAELNLITLQAGVRSNDTSVALETGGFVILAAALLAKDRLDRRRNKINPNL